MGQSDNKIIAFSGVEGAHADLACRNAFPYMDAKAFGSFEEAFNAVEDGSAEICMIPIGNSYAGRVAEIHNILPHTKLSIISEYFLKIEHHLCALPGTKIEDVKEVYSHPQALMQCKNSLVEMGATPISYSNTAQAAQAIRKWGDNNKAALCSELAAELYGLEVIKKNMQDDENNTTLFLAFSKEPIDPDSIKGSDIITSMLFTTRNIPAGLYKALGGFATNNVNIIKLESYIPETESASAQFFISFEGSANEDNVRLATEELGFFTKRTKFLGVYPAHKNRRKFD